MTHIRSHHHLPSIDRGINLSPQQLEILIQQINESSPELERGVAVAFNASAIIDSSIEHGFDAVSSSFSRETTRQSTSVPQTSISSRVAVNENAVEHPADMVSRVYVNHLDQCNNKFRSKTLVSVPRMPATSNVFGGIYGISKSSSN